MEYRNRNYYTLIQLNCLDDTLFCIAREKSRSSAEDKNFIRFFQKTSSGSFATDTTINNSIGFDDMQHLVASLQKPLLISDHWERVRLLTLCPPGCSRREISTFFSVSECEARMAMELYESNGVLWTYENNQDRGKLTPMTIQTVLDFYQSKLIAKIKWSNKRLHNLLC